MKEKEKEKKIVPRGRHILVRPDDEASRTTESGLMVPSSVEQEQRAIGTVLAVGDGIKDVKKGDRVIYGAFAGETLNFSRDPKKVEYKLLFDEDVIAFIK